MSRVAAEILGAIEAHQAGFTGRGEIVAVCDTGLDRGDLVDGHPLIPAGRVKSLLAYGRKHADDPHGHGTHVAGCISAADNGGDVCGTAPECEIILQSVFRTLDEPFGHRPVKTHNLLRDAYSRGARIHTNSWIQINSSAEYSRTAEDMDAYVFANPDLVVVTAVGNEGRFADPLGGPVPATLRSPSMAKNGIAVGASESEREGLSRTYGEFFAPTLAQRLPESIRLDNWANDRKDWAAFSGTGPTSDLRLKPDVVAPATAILSARSRRNFVGSAWGDFAHQDVAILGGTSTAAPLVAGCCAVIRQHLRESLGISAPSAALVKAVLINGTSVDLRVSRDGPALTFPNPIVGWGRVDLAESLALRDGAALWVQDVAVLQEGGSFRYRVTLAGTSGPLHVTLVWTDPPGRGLRSDLDLIVRCGAVERFGNQVGANPAFDRVNNVEQVRIDPADAVATIEVRGFQLRSGPQRFALAVAGQLDHVEVLS